MNSRDPVPVDILALIPKMTDLRGAYRCSGFRGRFDRDWHVRVSDYADVNYRFDRAFPARGHRCSVPPEATGGEHGWPGNAVTLKA